MAEQGRYTLGIGAGVLYYPDYIGAKSMQTLALPFPYIRYKSENFSIDEDGVRSRLFGINGLRLDMSLSGSLPASQSKNTPREGMPALELTGEVGPKLLYEFYAHGKAILEFECDARAALSTNYSSISYRGYLINPQLKYSLNYKRIEWTIRAGVLFNDAVYNNYYYGVSSEYITPLRKGYEAQGGYSGTRFRVGTTYMAKKWWLGGFVSYHDINSAVFQDSPLVEVKNGLYVGASIAYLFYTNEL